MAPQLRSHQLTRLFNLMLLRVDRSFKASGRQGRQQIP
ncbi:unnamed protein product [Musa acuminata subsp. malaccensis]|uniref:(wild Malaysian banana) hypothetical protein n=1 Tax=Musa acuminata subsp. malaccensis TaxID=214687 RepID=A0A804JVL7_MUSAM|nr:unnamed protein product [Musa acuminata subsp. malaccensis]